MTLPLLHGYDLTKPQDRTRLHEYFTNYTPHKFFYRGWTCWIISSPIGNLNGYVEAKEEFIDWLKKEDHFEKLEVHGGLTWEGGELILPEMKDAYVIGFDTAHFRDVLAMDVDPKFLAILKRPDSDYELHNTNNLWLESDVEKELMRLVDQLADLHDTYRRDNYVR